MRSTAGHSVSEKDHHAHKILVIEDNEVTKDSVLLLLRSEGFEADGVENGQEALRVLREGYEACLILLDLLMPEMNGWAFREAQRRDPQLAGIPVALLTGTPGAAREAGKLGAVAAFQKPLAVMALLDVVTAHCTRTGTRRSAWRI
jgi:CheY-like chemotaxis protein